MERMISLGVQSSRDVTSRDWKEKENIGGWVTRYCYNLEIIIIIIF